MMDNTTLKYDCIVIGAGISGISFAHYLTKMGQKVLLLEQNDKIGGQVQSLKSQVVADYWRELGAHTCYNSYTHLLSIVKDIDGNDLIQPLAKGSYVVHSEGCIKKMFSEVGILSLFANGSKLFLSKKEDKTVKKYFQNIVGKKNYEKVFTYLFRAVLSQNADEYPAEVFLKRRKERHKDYPRKYTFNGGLTSFLEAIVNYDKLNIIKNWDVLAVQLLKDGENASYKIIDIEGNSYQSNKIAFATNSTTTARLVRDMDDDLAKLLLSIPLSNSESLNVIVPKNKLSLAIVAGIIPLSDEFHSAVSRDLIDHSEYRSFTFHFEKGEKETQEKLDIICSVLNIVQDDITEWNEVSHVLPSLRMEHLNMAQQVEKIQKRNDMYILGNYFYGLSLEDCIHRSFDEAKKYQTNN